MQRTKTLTLFQGDDEQFAAAITSEDDGAVYDLADAAVTVYLKPDAATDDDDASVVALTVGDGIEVLDAAAGSVEVTVPRAWLATAGTRWWHMVVVKDGATRTAARGPVHVLET